MLANGPTVFTALLAVVGLLIGSFLNVCIYRLINELSVVLPRSFCPTCREDIAWFDNIPVLSYLLLRGKCRHCEERIGWRYPFVELLTAVAFGFVAARYGPHLACLKWCVFEAILIALCFTDLEDRFLPDKFTVGGCIIGFIFAVFVHLQGVFSELFLSRAGPIVQSLFEALLGSLILALPIWGFAEFYGRLRKKEMLGLGDVKLLLMIGAFLGLERGITALLIGSVSGVVFGGAYILITRQRLGSYELPYGTFFCLGAGLLPLFSVI